MKDFDRIIVGGGFFGCMVALRYAARGEDVAVMECEDTILARASYKNQARIHNGYHYPRSLATAASSHANYQRFKADFPSCVFADHLMLYAIAAHSKTTVADFTALCARIGSPLVPAPTPILRLFNPRAVDAVFVVEEDVFDAVRLRDELLRRLRAAGVTLLFNTTVTHVGDRTVATTRGEYRSPHTVLCTYADINPLLAASGLQEFAFKNERTRMPLVRVPAALRDYGITIMDGDFFGLMPFPSENAHTIHHVKYTPDPRCTYDQMMADVIHYLPDMRDAVHVGDIFETKTTLVECEETDARPILYRKDYHIHGLDVVLGGKLDNVYDIFTVLDDPTAKNVNII